MKNDSSNVMNGGARHIGLFLPSLRGGGAERAMLDLARGFARQGDRVDLILAKAEGPYLEQVPAEVNVVDLGRYRIRQCLPALVRYLRQRKPEAVLSTPSHANLAAICACRLSGHKTRLTIREATTLSQSIKHKSRLEAWKRVQLVKWLYPAADHIVAVSAGVAEDLHRVANLSGEGISVIYNPVVTTELAGLALEPVDHPWLNDQRIPLVLGIGRLSRAKNFSLLIRALALVNRRMPARLVILGEGEHRHQLERLVAELGLDDRVHLPGFVANPFNFMARATLCVLSSVQEGFPNVLVQAMALGTPVVATNCPYGPAEILADGKFGRLVPVDDAAALAQAIVDELSHGSKNDPRLALELKTRADLYSQARSVEEYSRVCFRDRRGVVGTC